MKLFGGYVSAFRDPDGYGILPVTLTDTNLESALSGLEQHNKENVFKASEGWILHRQALIEVTDEQINRVTA
jgi:hypothetical protein